MFTLHGWDPNVKRLEDWITRRLMETYPLFAGKHGKAAAAKLASTNRIAVILDGLDEMSDELQPVALQALSTQAAFRLVLLGRTTEMAAAAEQALLAGAVTVELQEITPSVAADYLTRVQLDPPPSGWHELTIRLRAMPDSPLAKALSTPLSLTFVRDTYHKGDSVRDLLRFCDAGGPDISSEEIEDHLLDRVLPAAYAPQPGQTPCKYELEKAQHSLALIAVRMNDEGTRDLAWWQISDVATTYHQHHSTLPIDMGCGRNRYWVYRRTGGLANGLGFGIVFGLLGAILAALLATAATNQPLQMVSPRRSEIFNRKFIMNGLMTAVSSGLIFGLIIAFVPPAEGPNGPWGLDCAPDVKSAPELGQ